MLVTDTEERTVRNGLARDDEVAAWQENGWVLLEGLVPTDVIDAANADLAEMFPSAAEYHADPDRARERWLGTPPVRPEAFKWPEHGPGFRPQQHIWHAEFPFPGAGAMSRLCVHPTVVDFAERALASVDIRLYQIHLSAKYAGQDNYEQPMHTDRNHSWLPAISAPQYRNLETFLYLSDVNEGNAPTHLVPRADAGDRATTVWGVMPDSDPDLYAAEVSAPGVRGSLLAYRNDVFHRGVDLEQPDAARFLLALAFKRANQDWIGYTTHQSKSSSPGWVAFAEGSTPRELELFGFPPPGHEVWTAALLDATAERYPKLDLGPWRRSLT